ncbi:MAG: DUF3592 domain-containing protein [Phycisphaeraceae bacterium]
MNGSDLRKRLVALIVALAWTAVVVGVTYMLLLPLIGQWEARKYLTTTGIVTGSEVQRQPGERGAQYQARIEFEYEVAGVQWSNDRYGFSPMWSTNRRAAKAVVDRYPAGSSVTVFYDGNDPGQSVLEVSPSGSELVWLLLMTPFVVVTILMWYVPGSYLVWHYGQNEMIAGATLKHRAHGVVLRSYRVSPLILAVVAAGAAGFVLAVVLIPVDHVVPLRSGVINWTFLVVGLAAAGGAVAAITLNGGAPRTILINAEKRYMTAHWFSRCQQIDFRHIQSVRVLPTWLTFWKKAPVYTHRVQVQYANDANGRSESLVLPATLTEEWAQELAGWLRRQTGKTHAHD